MRSIFSKIAAVICHGPFSQSSGTHILKRGIILGVLKFRIVFKLTIEYIDWFHLWKLCAHGRIYAKFMIFWVYKVFCMLNPMVSCYKVTNDQKGSKMDAKSKMPTKNKMSAKKKTITQMMPF